MTKANNGKGNNPLRDGWQTPQDLWDKLHKQYKFNFDCCASKDNTKCKSFSSKFETDILEPVDLRITQSICWMNPPFSIAWKMFETFFGIVGKGVAIYRCDNLETGLWQKIILPNATWIFIPNKRISYDGLDGDGARFPSALIGFNVDPPQELEGTTLNTTTGGLLPSKKGNLINVNSKLNPSDLTLDSSSQSLRVV